MLSLMNKFPKVNNFRIEYGGFQTCKSIETSFSANAEALLPFLQYLSAMDSCLLQNIVVANDAANKLIKDLYTVSEERTVSTKLLRCLHVKPRIFNTTYSSLSEKAPLNFSTLSFENVSERKKIISIILNSVLYSQNHNQHNHNQHNHNQYHND